MNGNEIYGNDDWNVYRVHIGYRDKGFYKNINYIIHIVGKNYVFLKIE